MHANQKLIFDKFFLTLFFFRYVMELKSRHFKQRMPQIQ